MITFSQFVTLVENMRSNQKNYFRTRNISALTASKKFEHMVDDAIALFHREEERNAPKQLQLFGNETEP